MSRQTQGQGDEWPGPIDTAVRNSRSGARAARGFHYQDAIGALLAARMVARTSGFSSVTPEGLEDISTSGERTRHFQVKSRARHSQGFTTSELARVVVEVWEKEVSRVSLGAAPADLTIIVERTSVLEETVGEGLPIVGDERLEAIRAELVRRASPLLGEPDAIEALMSRTSLAHIPWHRAASETTRLLARELDVPRAVAEIASNSLRGRIATTTDDNSAAGTTADLRALSLQDAVAFLAQVTTALDGPRARAALTSGSCEVLDFSPSQSDLDYFLGTACEPGHVAMGLAARRDGLTELVLSELERQVPVLITGPSGVGKSTALWQVAKDLQQVLWFRATRLGDSTVESVLDTIRTAQPGPNTPVGLAVDDIDDASANAWDHLARLAARTPGFYLVGSVRNENLPTVQSLSRCRLTPIALDEGVAERIHDQLARAGHTTARHWREAFDDAHGLTLEFTHILTQGRRLREVIGEQVAIRTKESRDTEFDLITLVSTAHRWGASLTYPQLAALTSLSESETRKALSRLADEHLVRIRGGSVEGLHMLRSRTLSTIAHESAPPSITSTVRRLAVVGGAGVTGKVVAGALIDVPDESTEILSIALEALAQTHDPALFSDVLTAIRVADVHDLCARWHGALVQSEVPPALWLTTLQLSMIGSDAGSLPTAPGVADATETLRSIRNERMERLSHFLDSLGPNAITRFIFNCESTEQATKILAAARDGFSLDDIPAEIEPTSTPLIRAIEKAPLGELCDLLGTARAASESLASTLFELAGGAESMLDRFRAHEQWLELATLSGTNEASTVTMRIAAVSDDAEKDLDAAVRDIARSALNAFPTCAEVDVAAVDPLGGFLDVADFPYARVSFARRGTYTDAVVEWNRHMMHAAAAQFGRATRTERAAQALAISDRLADFVLLVGRIWVSQVNRPEEARRARELSDELRAAINQLVQPGGVAPQPGEGVPPPPTDALYNLADGALRRIVGRLTNPTEWPKLAADIYTNLLRELRETRESEEWHLLGEGPPPSLDRLELHLANLGAIASERCVTTDGIAAQARAARSGQSSGSLERAGRVATRSAMQRHARWWGALGTDLAKAGVRCEVHTRELATSSAAKWPPVEVALGLTCTDMGNWIAARQFVVEELQNRLGAAAQSPDVIVFPAFDEGIPADEVTLARRLPRPAPEAIKSWPGLAERVIETPTRDCFSTCVRHIVRVSSLATLSNRLGPGMHPLSERINAELERTWAILAKERVSLSQATEGSAIRAEFDAVLDAFESDVQGEISGDLAPDSLALWQSINSLATDALAGAPIDDERATMTLFCMILAAQIDLDPENVARLLE